VETAANQPGCRPSRMFGRFERSSCLVARFHQRLQHRSARELIGKALKPRCRKHPHMALPCRPMLRHRATVVRVAQAEGVVRRHSVAVASGTSRDNGNDDLVDACLWRGLAVIDPHPSVRFGSDFCRIDPKRVDPIQRRWIEAFLFFPMPACFYHITQIGFGL
jgi:hypothetical protein